MPSEAASPTVTTWSIVSGLFAVTDPPAPALEAVSVPPPDTATSSIVNAPSFVTSIVPPTAKARVSASSSKAPPTSPECPAPTFPPASRETLAAVTSACASKPNSCTLPAAPRAFSVTRSVARTLWA
ncbi:hypothetical protein LzC2_26450 [Planctomycetes bacterium LzC2]|uniref:Uncharacterized protein n=1 Tax=Alienimonas chondri TaxID=2681879 RepID=A0ABX1VGI5_9PLAN|nr:hypothetical protein [Alienimonas chondri]